MSSMSDLAEQRALVRAQVRLAPVAAESVELRSQRSDLRGSCPFHPDTARGLYVGPNDRFHCFSCGAGGDVVDWTMRVHQIDEAAAITRLLQCPPGTASNGLTPDHS
jgi:DNA primase